MLMLVAQGSRGIDLVLQLAMNKTVLLLFILSTGLYAKAQVGERNPPVYNPTNTSRVLNTARVLDQKDSEECYAYQATETIESLPAHLLVEGRQTGPLSVDYIIVTKWKMWLKDAIVKGVDAAEPAPTNQGVSTYYFPGGLFSEYLMIAAQGLPSETEYYLDHPTNTWKFGSFYSDMTKAATKAHTLYLQNPQTPIEQLMQPGLQIIARRTGVEHSTTPSLTLAKVFPAGTAVHFEYPSDPAYGFKSPFFKTWTLNLMPASTGIPLLKEFIPSAQLSQNLKKQIDAGIPVPTDLFFFGNKRALSAAHGLMVIGYELNEDGKTVSHWKIQSSWGTEYADNGTTWFTDADLMSHLIDAWMIEIPSAIPGLVRP